MAVTADIDTNIGKVRFEIGDSSIGQGVLPGGANFDDSEVQYALTQSGENVKPAAAILAGIAAARWASQPQSFSVDGLSLNRGDAAARFREMAARLTDSEAAIASGVAMVTGISYGIDPYASNTLAEWL